MSKSNSLNILVVEDEDLIRTSLFRFLQKRTHTVTVASDGHEGLEKLESGVYDLVVLDLLMPRKSGFDFLTEMNCQVPVIVISAFTGQNDIDNQFEKYSQVIGFMKKPFESLAIISEYIESTYENYIRKI